MKIEKINNNKVKIILSATDIEDLELDLSQASTNTFKTQEIFWNLMKYAEDEVGFKIDDSQLVVEATQFQSDGMVIVITRIDNSDFDSITQFIKDKFKKPILRVKKKVNKNPSELTVVKFKTFDDVCSVATLLEAIYSGNTSLYKYDNNYYLVIGKNVYSDITSKTLEAFLIEYGTVLNNPAIQEGILTEHAELLIKHSALDNLRTYFK